MLIVMYVCMYVCVYVYMYVGFSVGSRLCMAAYPARDNVIRHVCMYVWKDGWVAAYSAGDHVCMYVCSVVLEVDFVWYRNL